MSIAVMRSDEDHVRLEFQPDLGKLFGFAKLVALLFGAVGVAILFLSTGRGGCGLLGALLPAALWFGLRAFERRRGPTLAFEISIPERTLRVPAVLGAPGRTYTFGHVGYVSLDAYTHVAGTSNHRSSLRVTRLSFVGRECDEAELKERRQEIEARPPSSKHVPPPPGDGDLLVHSLPYAVARALGRELRHAFGFSVVDFTSAPPRVFPPDAPDYDLSALRAAANLPAPAEPPRGVRRRESPECVVLSYAPSSLGLRIAVLAGLPLLAAVFFLCSGGKLYIALWPLLLGLLVVGRVRVEITPEGVTTAGTWLGMAVGRSFLAYDALTDISASTGKDYPCLRLTADGETKQVTAPNMDVARYLAACALYPPERPRPATGPYR